MEPASHVSPIDLNHAETTEWTEAFAALRMNRGIQKALAGKNIETV